MVAWTDYYGGADGSYEDVRTTAGISVGSVKDPVAAGAPGGHFVVGWRPGRTCNEYGACTTDSGHARFATVAPSQSAVRDASENDPGEHDQLAVSMSPTRDVIVAWRLQPGAELRGPQPPAPTAIAARAYSCRGDASTPSAQLISSAESGADGRPSVAIGDAGHVVVVWNRERAEGDGHDLYGRRFTLSGRCPRCADIVEDDRISASDALGVLGAAIGKFQCSLDVCDVDGDGGTDATDALVALKWSVGHAGVDLACPVSPAEPVRNATP